MVVPLLVLLLGAGFLLPSSLQAQEVLPATTTAKRIEENNRTSLVPTEAVIPEEGGVALPKPVKIEQSLKFNHGGWVTARYLGFNNIDNDKSAADQLTTYSSFDLRYWLRWQYKPDVSKINEHQAYVRVKDQYIRRTGDDPGAERYDVRGPLLDQAYVIMDYRPVWVEAGRRYFNVGRGIVYSDVNDGVQLNFRKPGFNAGVFAAHSLPHQSNIDYSIPGYDKDSDRYFYGLGIGYTGIPHHSLYAFLLIQADRSDPEPPSEKTYTYNSEYAGIGAKGDLIKDWTYWVELIGQTGSSRIFDSNARKPIAAWASDVEFFWTPQVAHHPRLQLQYAFGSGDADRINVTNTEFGNSRGWDHNFLYFGYLPTGYALAPQLSNLHMFKIGADIVPFESVSLLKRLVLGLDFYQFVKHRSGGGISDLDATNGKRGIGQELDLSAHWRINRRLTFTCEFGQFFPGRAYASPADDSQRFFSAYLTHTF